MKYPLSLADRFFDKKQLFLLAGLCILSAWLIHLYGMVSGLVILMLPVAIVFVIATYQRPIVGLYALFFLSFFLNIISRYFVKDLFPTGILVDALIAYIYVILLFKSLSEKIEWKKAGDAPVFVFFIWLLYCFTSLFNPECPGFSSFLIGVRPFLYMVLTVPLFCMLLNAKSLKIFVICWGIFSILLTIKGFIQLNIGLDTVEQSLIAGRLKNTHLLWGKLRVFSFLSDAGQFGASQAHAGLVGAILFLGAKSLKERLFYLIVCIAGIYGMFISGTRTAMFVLLGGGLTYLLLVRNAKLWLLVLLCGGTFFYAMKFTYVGHSNYEIRRMRSAFNPDKDASYQVRKANQARFRDYLSSRPFGGGIGSIAAGTPGTFLGETPPDSGYVTIWGQQGIVGLVMFLAMIVYFLTKGAWQVWFNIKNDWLRTVLIALIAGIGGMAVANYGNPVMLQHPTSLVMFLSIALIFCASRIDGEMDQSLSEK
ncbi:MAG: hypothetical protein LBQ60_19885 [Bacteroidales bacterium]|nr:hypothetical protein [Bacteroidales bacterium]